jgi:Mn2+/Fe2+ NRAMP family transporter
VSSFIILLEARQMPDTSRDETVEVIEVEEEPHPSPLQAIAQQQVEYVVIATSTVATTIFTVLASAAGLVAALAWNTALSHWLPTIIKLNDPLEKDFAYAGIATVVAAVTIILLGVVNNRLQPKHLLKRTQKSADG